MRTQAQIDAIVAEAKLAYSYKANEFQALRQRGIEESVIDETFSQFTLVNNLLNAIESEILTLPQQDELCDRIIQSGFFSLIDSNLYNEDVYDEDMTTM